MLCALPPRNAVLQRLLFHKNAMRRGRLFICFWLLGKALQVVERGGLFGLAQGQGDGGDPLQAVYLVTSHIDRWHACKGVHRSAIAGQQHCAGIGTRGALAAGFAPSQNDAGRHALQVPLEWSTNSLVEVVDVEYQPAIGGGIRAQVTHMGISAKLGRDAGVR